jgi:hypothetical protein
MHTHRAHKNKLSNTNSQIKNIFTSKFLFMYGVTFLQHLLRAVKIIKNFLAKQEHFKVMSSRTL